MDGLKERRIQKLSQVDTDQATNVFERDWQNLLILDGCRHDLYEEVNGPTQSRISVASNTKGYIRRIFSANTYDDVIYVTANPRFHASFFQDVVGRKAADCFHDVHHLYLEEWDNPYNVVPPQAMADKFAEVRDSNPDKRIVLHFIQPHIPFLNSPWFRELLDENGVDRFTWDDCENGTIDREQAWQAYRENLEWAMDAVEGVKSAAGQRTVVTSDHGNLVGEAGLYGHYQGYSAGVLRRVPWQVIA